MTDRREDDMATIAWPGFVDILSAVIIMFVFFVMVIVVVLFIYTIKFTATIQQQTEERVTESSSSPSAETMSELEAKRITTVKEIKQLEEEKQKIEKEVASLKGIAEQINTGLADSNSQEVIVEGNVMTVLFEDSSITLTEKTIDEISTFVQSASSSASVNLRAGDNPDAATQSSYRQLTWARMLNIRNIAIDQNISSDKISINYVAGENIEGNYNWVKLELE